MALVEGSLDVQSVRVCGREIRADCVGAWERRRVFTGDRVARLRGRSVRDGDGSGSITSTRWYHENEGPQPPDHTDWLYTRTGSVS